ncbi:MAG TPA: bis(5'-nucleosyl)-tetraphosphatase (symmetrical) YqeK [Candidatus Onthousia faecigallinarum]|nr:bis(5'-nucleosyl)-tetraphosphatase (symmetrical) YqeK [Candidatus Onthousia faecigallinarum]
MWDVVKIKEDLKKMLSEERYQHCLRTAEVAKELAKHYHYDQEKAYVTALVHDIAKEFSEKENEEFVKKHQLDKALLNEKNKKFIHGFLGAEIAKEKFHFDDEMCEAIRYHTAGKENMGKLALIVALADKIEPGKKYKGIEQERALAYQSLEEAFLYCLEMNLIHLQQEGKKIHPQTEKSIAYLKKVLQN